MRRLKALLDGERRDESSGNDRQAPLEGGLPLLQLDRERVVLIDGSAAAAADEFAAAAAAARADLAAGGSLRVAIDAEWEDPRRRECLEDLGTLAQLGPSRLEFD